MAKGRKTGGRKRGTANRITREVRETFRLVLENLAPEAEGWIRAAANDNPARGAELVLKLSEMFVPRLVRQEPSSVEPLPPAVDLRGWTNEELERAIRGEESPSVNAEWRGPLR